MRLIPDTNFLIYLAKYKLLDKLEIYEMLILKQVFGELQKLSKSKQVKTEDKKYCSIVLDFLKILDKKKKIKMINGVEGNADDAILSLAFDTKALVGTMDQLLVKRLKAQKIPVLYVRQKKFLEEK